jgi:tetrapyrrole methylase family protein/MazG family protein
MLKSKIAGGNMDYVKRLEKLMTRLRAPKGCPWDRRQTHKSLKPYLLEEAHEVLDAIDAGKPEALREELGDLLLQVVFHSQLAKERKTFNFQQVAKTIGDKLIRRHPHVFGKGASRKIADINRKWEELKRQEKPERKSVLDGLPHSLPALLGAQRMQEKLSQYNFLPQSPARIENLVEKEWKNFKQAQHRKDRRRSEGSLGLVIFYLALSAQSQKLNAETALGQINRKMGKRFKKMEQDFLRREKKKL